LREMVRTNLKRQNEDWFRLGGGARGEGGVSQFLRGGLSGWRSGTGSSDLKKRCISVVACVTISGSGGKENEGKKTIIGSSGKKKRTLMKKGEPQTP